MRKLVRNTCAKRDRCVHCRKPVYWTLQHPQCVTLRLVSKRWRHIFTHHVVLFMIANRHMMCSSPLKCLRQHELYMRSRLRSKPQSFIPVNVNMGFIDAITDSDESYETESE